MKDQMSSNVSFWCHQMCQTKKLSTAFGGYTNTRIIYIYILRNRKKEKLWVIIFFGLRRS